MNKIYSIFIAVFMVIGFTMCNASKKQTPPTIISQKPEMPQFDADSAYNYIAQQIAFGPRVPGTPAQKNCAAWLKSELERHGATVIVQETETKVYTGATVPVFNIIGSFNPESKSRVLLISHWDCRPISDNDPDHSKYHQPVDGANDGASGVGVLLEIARLAGITSPKIGIDIFFTDVEDYGAPEGYSGEHRANYWALGTQAWCRKPHVDGYRANYGILLDMVGAKDATFYREYYSDRYAHDVADRVWATASHLGLGHHFINQDGAGITDDHVFVNQMTGIPTIDIIDTRQDGDGTFYPHWHTSEDTLDKIDKETLAAVGKLLVNLIY